MMAKMLCIRSGKPSSDQKEIRKPVAARRILLQTRNLQQNQGKIRVTITLSKPLDLKLDAY
jgi:hypothetical protein